MTDAKRTAARGVYILYMMSFGRARLYVPTLATLARHGRLDPSLLIGKRGCCTREVDTLGTLHYLICLKMIGNDAIKCMSV